MLAEIYFGSKCVHGKKVVKILFLSVELNFFSLDWAVLSEIKGDNYGCGRKLHASVPDSSDSVGIIHERGTPIRTFLPSL